MTVKGVPIELTPVKSSNLVGVGYRSVQPGSDALLIVQFKSGAVYTYRHVPKEVHAALMAAPSKGKYLAAHIVANREYVFEKIATAESVNRFTQEKKA